MDTDGASGLSECFICSEGTYQPGFGSHNCSNCPTGKTIVAVCVFMDALG
jgi:hypothetical protein